MLELSMLPASEGDCLLLRYGDGKAQYRLLVDAGRKATYKKLLEALPPGDRHIELFVVTHVDRDHIEGALDLLGDAAAGFSFGDIWFNAYRHLVWDAESFGAVQGETLTSLIEDRELPWNLAFQGGPVRLDGKEPVTRELPGGLRITLLSPDRKKLEALINRWEQDCATAGILPSTVAAADSGDHPVDPDWDPGIESFGGSLEDLAAMNTKEDSAPPNGSSIAFLAEYEGKAILFGADAHPALLVRSLDALGRPLPIECALVKLPHHGSQANVTRALLERVKSAHYFVSTNGNYFDHPDDVAIARVLTRDTAPKTLYFNYRSDRTRPWDESPDQKAEYRYACVFPATEDAPLTLGL